MPDIEASVHESIDGVKGWNDVVTRSALGSFFHRSEWLRCIEEGTGMEACHVVATKDTNPVGVFPNFVKDIDRTPFRKLVSTTPGFGGPVVTSDERSVMDLLLERCGEVCGGGVITHKITALDSGYVKYGEYMESRGYAPNLELCRFEVDLARGWGDIREGMDSRKRGNLEKARERDPRVVEEGLSESNLREFHGVYGDAMDRVGGATLPLSFFLEVGGRLRDRTKLMSVFVDGERVGSHMYFLDDERDSLHHYFSAVLRDNFEYYPSELLHAHMMRWGIDNGYEAYDFGGTDPDYGAGLFQYKEEFGGRSIPLLSWEKTYSRVGWNTFRAGNYVYQRLVG